MLSTLNPLSPIIKIKAIDAYQSASVLSTSNEPCLPHPGVIYSAQSTSQPLPEFLKKKRGVPTCIQCIADDCTLLFDKMEDYENHIKTHENLIKCEYPGCQKQFIDGLNLKKHYKFHFPSKKIHFCPFPGCNKSFTASYNLTIHYRIHKGDRPYECEKCGQKFFDRANYKYHITVKHLEVKINERICKHKGCNHISKTSKQNLIHHEKLEPECKNEKNNLFNLLNNFIFSVKEIMDLKGELKEDFEKLKQEKDFKDEVVNVEKQALHLIEIAVDKDQYKGIIGNY